VAADAARVQQEAAEKTIADLWSGTGASALESLDTRVQREGSLGAQTGALWATTAPLVAAGPARRVEDIQNPPVAPAMSHADLIAAITAATSHITADIQSRMDVQNAFMQNALAAVVQGQGQVEGEFLLAPGATEE
jgi:hypothetical protein